MLLDGATQKDLLGIIFNRYYESHPLFGRHLYIDIWCSSITSGISGLGRLSITQTLVKAYSLGFRHVRLAASTKSETLLSTYLGMGFRRIGIIKERDVAKSAATSNKTLETLYDDKDHDYDLMGLILTEEYMEERSIRICADFSSSEVMLLCDGNPTP